MLAAAIAAVGCGSSAGVTCGELNSARGRYAREAATLYDNELIEVSREDCNLRCEQAFKKSIERRLRKECADAASDYEPKQAVVDWLHSD